MTNADIFKNIFGLYATELWSMPEKDFLEWLNSEVSNSSESPNGWISCKKKLPEKSEKYEVTIKNVTTIFDGETGDVVERVGYYVDCDIYKSYLLRKWHRYDGGQVIAWRKLPEPYQPKEDES